MWLSPSSGHRPRVQTQGISVLARSSLGNSGAMILETLTWLLSASSAEGKEGKGSSNQHRQSHAQVPFCPAHLSNNPAYSLIWCLCNP